MELGYIQYDGKAKYVSLDSMQTTSCHINVLIRILVVTAAATVEFQNASAQTLRDYRCKIERVETTEIPPNSRLEFQTKNYVDREFTVERRTGVMAGALKNSYITKPEVIDYGSAENSYKVVTTLRTEQGLGPGSNAYLLVINEYKEGLAKPFLFVENDVAYFGTCIHF
jgi:hypothetical protein